MPIELTWMMPGKILLSRWYGAVNQQHAKTLVDELGTILDAASEPVHTIVDLSEITDLHPNAAYYYLRSRIPTHPRRGRVGLVGWSLQEEVLADLLNRVSDREMFRLFDSRDEARDYLLSHDTPPPVLRLALKDLLGADEASEVWDEPEADEPTDVDPPEDET